jgi:signal transduction histidine kinase
MTIARKLAIGLSLLSFIGIGAMLVVVWGLATANHALRHLSEIREPISRASNEMEINLKGVGLGVFKYLDSGDERARRQVEDDATDFEVFHGRYFDLAQTYAELELWRELGALFDVFRTLGFSLMWKKDVVASKVAEVAVNLNELDHLVAGQLRGELGVDDRTLIAWLDVEADIAAVVAWRATYRRTHREEYRARIRRSDDALRSSAALLRSMLSSPREQVELGSILDRTMALLQEIIAADEHLEAEATRFDALRNTIGEILDGQVQPLAYQSLYAPRLEAEAATRRVEDALWILIPFFAMSALAVGMILNRIITRPIERLTQGTAAIREGSLGFRVERMGNDELGELADAFNGMVEQLEGSTVSRERLEASEAELRATVASLRTEIAERVRVESDRARLEESLRRSETMSAMGSLVAGVAHEVRNPLFGISSTLDAFELRLGPREETQRHLAVLRGEVERMNRLMHDLLAYGRPVDGALTPESASAVIDEAIRSCATLASAAGVEIERAVEGIDPVVRVDRTAIGQAFRNLLENAIQHSPPGSVVELSVAMATEDGSPCLRFRVKDSGPGFPESDLPRVFEPFFTKRRGGTGLGLSIVQRIVDQHEGKVHAANDPKGGAVVTIVLPLAGRLARAS